MRYIIVLCAVSMLSGITLLSAQTATPRVDKREVRQQKRIEQGEKSGQLTPREKKRLERREAKIQKDEAAAKSDGKVTVGGTP